MELLLFIVGCAAGVVLLLAPGCLSAACVHRAIASRRPDAASGVGWVLVALGWGCGVVPLAAMALCLATGVRIGWATLALVAVANVAIAGLVWRRDMRSDEGDGPRAIAVHLRAAMPVLAVAAGVGALWLLTCDQRSHVSESCLFRTAYAAAGYVAPMSEVPPDIDLLRSNVQDARLGNVGVLSAFLVMFQGLGFRLLFGVCGAMLALGGYLIGAWCGGHRRWGWVGLALLSLNPYALSLPMVDENLLTLAFASCVIPFVAARRGGWIVAGVLFGLVVAMRHVMLPALPAMLVAAGVSRARWQPAARLAAAFAVTVFPVALHHHLALGSVLRFESNELFLPFTYRFLGLEFVFEGLLNWPFRDALVRTPHNPFPMLVWWPLHLADHAGSLLSASALVGFVAVWRRSRRAAWFWALWAPFVMLGVSLQEGWDIVNKMWVMLIAAGALTAWTVAGLAWIAARPKVGVAVLVVVAVTLQVGVLPLRGWQAPADSRYVCVEPGVGPEENDARRRASRERATSIAPWPDYGRLAHNGPYLATAKLTGLWPALRSPGIPVRSRPWGWFPGEPPPSGPAVTIEIDLGEALHGRTDFVRPATGPPHIDLARDGAAVAMESVAVPWDAGPLVLYAGRSDALSAVVLFFDRREFPFRCKDPVETPGERLAVQRCWALFTLLGEEERCGEMRAVDAAGPIVRVRVPTGGLSVALEQSIGADRLYLWKGRVTAGQVSLAEPFVPWKN